MSRSVFFYKGLFCKDIKTVVTWFHLVPCLQVTGGKQVALRRSGACRRPVRSPGLAACKQLRTGLLEQETQTGCHENAGMKWGSGCPFW